jgi:hypothetical protein
VYSDAGPDATGMLNLFLVCAGFEPDAQYGDWDDGRVTRESQEIFTVARR